MNRAGRIRNVGFVACAVGVAVIALGWGLFAWSMFQRAAAARARLKDTHG